MRICSIFFIFYLSFSSLGFSQEKLDPNCEDELEKQIVTFLKNTKSELIPKLYHLTTLKLAAETARENRLTLEQLAQKWLHHLKRIDEAALINLRGLYQKYQLDLDVEKLHESFELAQYWQSPLRFENSDVSAFILAHSSLAPESQLNQTDAATVWLLQNLLEIYPKGSREFNQLNISSRVVRYTGAIIGKQKFSASELEEEFEPLLHEIDTSLGMIIDVYLKTHEACRDWWNFHQKCHQGLVLVDQILPSVFMTLKNDFHSLKIHRFAQDLEVEYGDVHFRLPLTPPAPDKKRANVTPPFMDLEQSLVLLDDKRRQSQEFMQIDDQAERIKFFHQSSADQKESLYGIIDKNEKRVTFYHSSKEQLASFRIISDFDNNDKAQGGGAGIYSFSYQSERGRFFLGDYQERNVGIRLESPEKAKRFFEDAKAIYILPNRSDFYFRLKDERLIFTRKARLNYPGDYNLTPRRKEYRPLVSFISNPEYRNSTSLEFVKTLDENKKELMQLYGLENDDYNDLARMAFGILGNESKFGASIKYKIKEVIPLIVSFAKGNYFNTSLNSRGPTQIKKVPKLIKDKYKIKKSDLKEPKNAALATLGFLAQTLEELKAKEHLHPDITPENRVDYLHYIYMGRSDEITQATATPEKNIYFKQVKEFSQSLVQVESP